MNVQYSVDHWDRLDDETRVQLLRLTDPIGAMRGYAREKRPTVFLARVDGEIIGWSLFNRDDHYFMVFVNYKFQGHNIGYQLGRLAREHSLSLGVPKITAFLMPHNVDYFRKTFGLVNLNFGDTTTLTPYFRADYSL